MTKFDHANRFVFNVIFFFPNTYKKPRLGKLRANQPFLSLHQQQREWKIQDHCRMTCSTTPIYIQVNMRTSTQRERHHQIL